MTCDNGTAHIFTLIQDEVFYGSAETNDFERHCQLTSKQIKYVINSVLKVRIFLSELLFIYFF